MKFIYERIDETAGQIIAETKNPQSKPQFSRLLTIALRLVIEIMVGLHLLQRGRSDEEAAYRNLQETCESLRKTIVQLKENGTGK